MGEASARTIGRVSKCPSAQVANLANLTLTTLTHALTLMSTCAHVFRMMRTADAGARVAGAVPEQRALSRTASLAVAARGSARSCDERGAALARAARGMRAAQAAGPAAARVLVGAGAVMNFRCATRPAPPMTPIAIAATADAGASARGAAVERCTRAHRIEKESTIEAFTIAAARPRSHPNSWLYVSVSIGTGAVIAASTTASVSVERALCSVAATNAPRPREMLKRVPSTAATSAMARRGSCRSNTIPSASSASGALAAHSGAASAATAGGTGSPDTASAPAPYSAIKQGLQSRLPTMGSSAQAEAPSDLAAARAQKAR